MTIATANKARWGTESLDRLIPDVKTGFPSGERLPHGVIQVRMNNVDLDGTLDLTTATRVPADESMIETYRLERGDVLFNNTNSTELVGKTAVFPGADEPVLFSNHFSRLRVDPGRLDPWYLGRWLSYQQRRSVFRDLCNRWVNQSAVRREALLGLEIPIPFPDDPRRSLAEQKRIAAILDKADTIRRRRQSVPQQYRDLIVSRFDEAFGDPIRNTRGFPTKPLEELVGSERPISYGILMPGPDTPGGVPYVRVAEMRDERLILESIRRTTPEIHAQYRRSTIRPGDILLSIRGHVGRLAMVPKALDGGNITQDTARLAIKDPDLAVYVFWLLDSPYTQRWMQGYVRGVAVKGINLGDVKRLPIMLPSPKAITQFAKFARAAFDAQDEAIAVTKHADELFNALVQRAFRGEL